ncbi:hypothetical protein LPB03_06455 [Polaribacter vadi]|uniref:Uncharacterized protein n=1 Tax=Polaribacter vadi TaxID=1774273 RepID=A0A1B8TZ72_9FLAO|nr:hypothetical protein [Polaribacter vadi]AOW17122.1 hypothetical protein LPB03_06455 [Polaribacter vadi]OBY64951.1 hypothetical protein LPB3_06035 [Polaribacter vadi]
MAELQTEQLNDFYINIGLDNNEMNHNFFKNYVEQNLHKSIHLLEKEIKHNLLVLDVRRLEIYFNQVIEKLENSTFLKFDDAKIEEYVKKYDLNKENILNINNKELIHYLTLIGDPFDPLHGANYESYFKAEKIKSIFYKYTAKHEILFFLDRIRSLQTKYIDKSVKKKISYAKLFSYELSKYDSLAIEHNYYAYYNSILLPYIAKVKEEVQEYILELNPIKIPLYLDKTIEEIENAGFQNESATIIDKYVSKYKIDLKKLPEVKDSKLREILSTKDFRQEMPYNEFSEIEYVQLNFYLYGLRTETIKLLDYLKGLQVNYQITSNVETKELLNYNKIVFKSYDTQKWFDTALRSLNTIDKDSVIRRGFQAIANTFYKDEVCKKYIFQYAFSLKDYIAHLNKEYAAGIERNDKLSESVNHIDKVNGLVMEYQSKLQNNTTE